MADATAIELFEKLRVEFDIDKKVTEWLTSPKGLAAKTLEDFLCACTEEGVKNLVEAAGPDNVFLATSRMRQAWRSLKSARDNDEAIIRSGNDTADMDDLLAVSVLDDIEARHWARYKMTWPPDIAPADTVISRIVRELEKRTLSVREVLKTRTQAHQQKAVRKRTKVAEGLEMVSATAEQDASPTLHNYMQSLLTLLIAYSKAGSKLRQDAPTTEVKTGESTKVVECPLDVLMRYYYRVQDRAHGMPYYAALAWVRRKDEAERTVWVDRYRNTDNSLGEVILHTMETREAMWELPTPEARKAPPPAPAGGGVPKGGGKGSKGVPGTFSKAPPPKPPPARRANSLQDGTPLCRNFNSGSCTSNARDCRYAHKCSVIARNGKACGMNHAAKDHR